MTDPTPPTGPAARTLAETAARLDLVLTALECIGLALKAPEPEPAPAAPPAPRIAVTVTIDGEPAFHLDETDACLAPSHAEEPLVATALADALAFIRNYPAEGVDEGPIRHPVLRPIADLIRAGLMVRESDLPVHARGVRIADLPEHLRPYFVPA